MAMVRVRGAVKRRTAGIAGERRRPSDSRALRTSSMKAAQRLIDYTTKHYSASEQDKAT